MPLTRRQIYRRRRIVVFGALFAVLAGIAYLPLTLLAPVTETDAAITTPQLSPAPEAELDWPSYGASAIGAVGFDGLLGRSGSKKALPMASITKIVTALTVLEKHPIGDGETGPTVTIGAEDIALYQHLLSLNSSVAPMSAGLRFTERELLQIALLDSAGNYAATLARWAFGSEEKFLSAARAWLDEHDLDAITIADPTGIDPKNTATADDLVRLGMLALADPALAEIVSTSSVEMHDIGRVTNTNDLLGRDGIDGIKTGTLRVIGSNLLFSADLAVGEQTVQLVGVVIGAPDHQRVNRDVRTLIDHAAAGFHEVPLIAAGDPVAGYTTSWGDTAKAVAARSASVVVWGDTPITAVVHAEAIRLGDDGASVGSVVFTAGDATVTVALELSDEVTDPGPWWRLGHPSIIFGMG